MQIYKYVFACDHLNMFEIANMSDKYDTKF